MIKISPTNRGTYTLAETYFFEYDGYCVVVPMGYEYDGASIPPAFWQVLGSPFHPKYMTAALAHDYLYTTHETTKEYADSLFKALLLQSGVNDISASLMYNAVHLFGGHWWNA